MARGVGEHVKAYIACELDGDVDVKMAKVVVVLLRYPGGTIDLGRGRGCIQVDK